MRRRRSPSGPRVRDARRPAMRGAPTGDQSRRTSRTRTDPVGGRRAPAANSESTTAIAAPSTRHARSGTRTSAREARRTRPDRGGFDRAHRTARSARGARSARCAGCGGRQLASSRAALVRQSPSRPAVIAEIPTLRAIAAHAARCGPYATCVTEYPLAASRRSDPSTARGVHATTARGSSSRDRPASAAWRPGSRTARRRSCSSGRACRRHVRAVRPRCLAGRSRSGSSLPSTR